MTLPANLHKEVVDFFISLPNIKDSNGRKAFIQGAVLDAQLQSQIDFSVPPVQFFQLLIPRLIEYGQLEDGRNALEAVLEAAKDYIGQDKKVHCDQLITQVRAALDKEKKPSVSDKIHAVEHPDLPTKTYDHFTGRDKELQQVIEALRKTEQQRLIALYGLGGIGKTALAREAADISLHQERFQRVVWVSAKTERFVGTDVEKFRRVQITIRLLSRLFEFYVMVLEPVLIFVIPFQRF